MDEFKRLPWPVSDIGTGQEETYELNMTAYQKENPNDVFLCHLLEIDPIHYRDQKTDYQEPNECNERQELTRCQFIDPRTGVEIPTQECNYKNVNFQKRNIFLNVYIQASNLQKYEHVACLNALRCITKHSEMSADEQKDRSLYESTAMTRCEEKRVFLDKLKEHFFAKLSSRFHYVPPSINHFITHNWKKRLIEMHRMLASAGYNLKTAILLHRSEWTVKMNTVHHEHLGNVPEMINQNGDYLRQSFSNLTKAYNRRKNRNSTPIMKQKVDDLIQMHGVDFVVPISILKIIANGQKGWSFCMTVKDSALSTTFNPKKEIILEKPLPPVYLSAYDRHKKGAKYLLHSCFNNNSLHFFNHNDKTESLTGIEVKPQELINTQAVSSVSSEVDYKISSCEEFVKQHSNVRSSKEITYDNSTFTIFNIIGCEDDDDIGETFKILVPAKQAAYKKSKNGEIQFLNYSPKIEFQSEYGAELMTKDELIREWCDLCFRPNTTTLRVRFDGESGKIIHRETVTLMDVEDELETQYGFETQQLLQRIWHTLQTLNGFPAGDYLLQSDAKQNDCVKVYEKSDNSTKSLSISQIIKNVSFEIDVFDKMDWRPIDDKIITEIHVNNQILPCAFPHTDYLKEHNVKSPKSIKSAKTAKKAKQMPKFVKIQPFDDSFEVSERAELKKKYHKNRIDAIKSQRNKRKKLKNKMKKKTIGNALKVDNKELKDAKDLLTATMDQYSTPTGTPFHKSAAFGQEAACSSVAYRTRIRSSSTNTLEKQQGYVRRSDRMIRWQTASDNQRSQRALDPNARP